MGASIYWTKPEVNYITNAGTSVYEALVKAFGPLPRTLTEDDLPVLRGMAATWGSGDNPYETLANVISEFGAIEVGATF